MTNTRTEFLKRLSEINIYFETIELIDKGVCKLVCTDISGNLTEKLINPELTTILKANGFLLLYNLVESTIKKSIEAIINSVHANNLTFNLLSDNLKTLWLNQEVRNIKDTSINAGKLRENIINITKEIIDNKLLNFKTECISISGNIDALEIRNIANKFGYIESQRGECLLTIKTMRNQLAHGEFTFADIGKNYTTTELIEFKHGAEDYLKDVLTQIELYITSQHFKKS